MKKFHEKFSTSTIAPLSRIVEKGTKKAQVIKEQAERLVQNIRKYSLAIVETAKFSLLPAAVLTETNESAVQPELPEALVSDKGVPEVQPQRYEAVSKQTRDPESREPLPEYTGVQAGAIVENQNR